MHVNLSTKQNQSAKQSSAVVKSIAWLILLSASMTISGCGNKGDLYLPEKDDTEKQESEE